MKSPQQIIQDGLLVNCICLKKTGYWSKLFVKIASNPFYSLLQGDYVFGSVGLFV